MFGRNWFVRRLTKEEMTPKLDYAAGMDEIQRPISAFLKGLGFRQRGRTYNRICADGLVHVINFQLGAYPLGGNEIKGLSPNLWGKFTVNLGVVLPRLYAANFGEAKKEFHRESDGGFNTRLGHLVNGADHWWPIEQPFGPVSATIQTGLEQHGLRFLDSFPDHRAIVTFYQKHGSLPYLSTGGHAIAAVAAFGCGERGLGSNFFARARDVEKLRADVNLRAARLAHLEKLERFCSQ
jgi:hypothetical protein